MLSLFCSADAGLMPGSKEGSRLEPGCGSEAQCEAAGFSYHSQERNRCLEWEAAFEEKPLKICRLRLGRYKSPWWQWGLQTDEAHSSNRPSSNSGLAACQLCDLGQVASFSESVRLWSGEPAHRVLKGSNRNIFKVRLAHGKCAKMVTTIRHSQGDVWGARSWSPHSQNSCLGQGRHGQLTCMSRKWPHTLAVANDSIRANAPGAFTPCGQH